MASIVMRCCLRPREYGNRRFRVGLRLNGSVNCNERGGRDCLREHYRIELIADTGESNANAGDEHCSWAAEMVCFHLKHLRQSLLDYRDQRCARRRGMCGLDRRRHGDEQTLS